MARKIDYTQLTSDLLAARRIAAFVASEALADDDRGSANFDECALSVGKGCMFGRFSTKLVEAFETAGLELDNDRIRGRIPFSLRFVSGQGHSRTRAIEVARKFLAAQGWEVSVFYQMD